MALLPIKTPAAGQRIRAAHLRTLADAIQGARNIVAGEGIEVSVTERGVAIALARLFKKFVVPALITEANGADPDDEPENVTYKAKAIGEPIELETARVPDYGRFIDSRVIKAKVDDLCFFIRDNDSDGIPRVRLVVLTEKIATDECGA